MRRKRPNSKGKVEVENEKSTVNAENPRTSVFRQEHLEDRRLPLTFLDLEQGKEKEKMGTDEETRENF